MSLPEHISASLAEQLRQKFSGFTQEEIARELDLSQSIVSRLLNGAYSVTSADNKTFKNISSKCGYGSPAEFWELLATMEVSNDDRISIGMSSYAVYTGPFIHCLRKDGFPAWLRLGYTHKTTNEDGKPDAGLVHPDWWDSSNFGERFNEKFNTKASESANPFADCYVSDILLSLVDCDANLPENRQFQSVFVPELTEEQRDKVDLVEVASIFSGFGSLLLVVSLEDDEKIKQSFTNDEKLKGYRIKNRALMRGQWNDQDKIVANKKDFLSHLKVEGNEPNFFLRGIEGSSSFDLFKHLWNAEQKIGRSAENKEDYDKFEYLMATRGTIDYSRTNGAGFDAIAQSLENNKKLVMVAHPPFLHNSWQRIMQPLKDEISKSTSRYIQQYRYNFSQWTGPQKYVLYISRKSLNAVNIQRINDLLINVQRRMDSVINNDDLRDFFYYDPEKNDANLEKIEKNFLYNLACSELCFNDQRAISYSTSFMKQLLDSIN